MEREKENVLKGNLFIIDDEDLKTKIAKKLSLSNLDDVERFIDEKA